MLVRRHLDPGITRARKAKYRLVPIIEDLGDRRWRRTLAHVRDQRPLSHDLIYLKLKVPSLKILANRARNGTFI